LEEEHYLYILDECMQNKAASDIDVILATDVEGILAVAAW